jgi:hypothetical protein
LCTKKKLRRFDKRDYSPKITTLHFLAPVVIQRCDSFFNDTRRIDDGADLLRKALALCLFRNVQQTSMVIAAMALRLDF